jgi:hypothetical protein
VDYQTPSSNGGQAGQPAGFLFPAWTNMIGAGIAIGVILLGGFLTFIPWYYFSPKNTDVGYAPVQPVPYSHKLHAGDLGIDCRYCHVNVEKSPVASVPPSQVCMNCHTVIKSKSPKLEPVRQSFATGLPVEWVRIHKIPDYAYFDHSRHVNRNVGCVSCHGRIDQMEVVRQSQPLSMSWCLDCHRNPAPNLRPKEAITQMDWKAPGDDPAAFGSELMARNSIHPPTDCSGCHR